MEPSAATPGPLWKLYSHLVEGRVLQKPDGTRGVVVCPKYHDYTRRFAPVYLVRWADKCESSEELAADVEAWLQEEFANETWVPKKIRAAQLAAWHHPTKEQLNSPLLKPRVGGRKHAQDSDVDMTACCSEDEDVVNACMTSRDADNDVAIVGSKSKGGAGGSSKRHGSGNSKGHATKKQAVAAAAAAQQSRASSAQHSASVITASSSGAGGSKSTAVSPSRCRPQAASKAAPVPASAMPRSAAAGSPTASLRNKRAVTNTLSPSRCNQRHVAPASAEPIVAPDSAAPTASAATAAATASPSTSILGWMANMVASPLKQISLGSLMQLRSPAQAHQHQQAADVSGPVSVVHKPHLSPCSPGVQAVSPFSPKRTHALLPPHGALRSGSEATKAKNKEAASAAAAGATTAMQQVPLEDVEAACVLQVFPAQQQKSHAPQQQQDRQQCPEAAEKCSVYQVASVKQEAAEEEYIQSWTGRRYPRSLVVRPGDKRLAELTPQDLEGDFFVEYIVDECKHDRKQCYLVKWQGYELNIGDGLKQKGDWEPAENLKDNLALLAWKTKPKPAYFTAAPKKAIWGKVHK